MTKVDSAEIQITVVEGYTFSLCIKRVLYVPLPFAVWINLNIINNAFPPLFKA
jgi:hypothetical protein